MPSLPCLPVELLLDVGHYLDDKDLAHLGQGNLLLSQVFFETLVKRSLKDKPPRPSLTPQKKIPMKPAPDSTIPALLWAIDYGYRYLVERITSQPDFDVRATETIEALHDAASVGDPNIVSILIQAGYEVNMPSTRVSRRHEGERRTPLHLSALNGHPAITEILLANGADIHAVDSDYQTAFLLAVMSVTHILDKILPGRNETSQFYAGMSENDIQLLHEIDRRAVSTLRVLVQHGAAPEISAIHPHGNTALHLAIGSCFGCHDGPDLTAGSGVIRYLVQHGADHLAHNEYGHSPLDYAVLEFPNKVALNYFLEIGVSPNFKNSNGRSLLSSALMSWYYSFPVVELLLNKGANPDDISIRDYLYGDEPLETVCESFLRLFFAYGVGFKGKEGECFTMAAHGGMLRVMKLIFERGADINVAACVIDGETKTPIQIAISWKHKKMMRFLMERGVKMSETEKAQVGRILGKKLK